MANETLEQKIARLEAENAKYQQELTDTQGIVAEQAEALANAEASKTEGAAIIVTYEKQQYRVIGKQFTIKGALVKAEELSTNKEAVKHLVETKSGLLQLIEKAVK